MNQAFWPIETEKSRTVFLNKPTSSGSGVRYTITPQDYINKFQAHLKKWKSEKAFYSDPDQIAAGEDYEGIVKLAKIVTPYIIEELRKGPSFLVWALDDAYKFTPYQQESVGDLNAMSNAWISWAERNGRTL